MPRMLVSTVMAVVLAASEVACGDDERARRLAVPSATRDCPRALLTALVGLTVDEARRRAARDGCTVRVARRDGEDLVVTQDLRPDRVDVAVEGGRVTAVLSVG